MKKHMPNDNCFDSLTKKLDIFVAFLLMFLLTERRLNVMS